MDLTEHFVDDEDDIVISGMAGRFPESDNMDELRDNLFANKDLITEDNRRWPPGLYGLPTRSGKLKQLNKFDAHYFGLSGKQADYMDPQGRILLEVTHEAIVDSGWNPSEFRGTNTAVIVGAFLTEAEESVASEASKVSGYGATGTKRNMLSNRVSFAFDLRGPSFSVDSACSSSMVALQMAYSGIRDKQFDMAIVGGVNINLRPTTALEFQRLSLLSSDGKCKHLDASVNGYVRSETVSVVVLQRRRTARRVYTTIIHAKVNSDGNKAEGVTYPSCQSEVELMENTLKESGVDPKYINYVEAHGTATPLGDVSETNAIYKVLCKNRSNPLLVGSVKSNLGHSEASSGLCSIAKMIITFENRKIPASLHFKEPNPAIKPLIAGSILPVTQNQDFEDCVVPINSFGFGGTNANVLIRPHQSSDAEEEGPDFHFEIPRLIVYNGRTEDSVNYFFDFVVNNREKVTDDFLALLNNVTTDSESNGMDFHGFIIRDVKEKDFIEQQRKIVKVVHKRPVWFVMAGLGSQWTGMARGLMDLDLFNKSIVNSTQILEPYGIDLTNVILSDSNESLTSIMNSSVGTAAIQLALIDILRALDIKADGFIGHSSGELCCGYADEALDAREFLLSSYWRAKCIEDIKVPKGMMAAVGLSWDQMSERLPPGIMIASHNAIDSVTISGNYEEVDKLLQELNSENIFTKKVNSCDIAFHSHTMKSVAPDMLKKLKSVSTSQRLRSHRWVSTSVPHCQWSTPAAKYSNAEYYVNNLISPVLFQEALQLIPKDAIVIEVSPCNLFRNIIQRSVGPDCTYVGLMKRNNADNNLVHLLTSIGDLFNLGLKPRIENLYPKIDYPVKRGTQSLGSLIKWDHQDDWLVTLYPEYFNMESKSEIIIKIDFKKDENKFYFGHKIDGRAIFPATGYLLVIWEEFAQQKFTTKEELPVIFENVCILNASPFGEDTQLEFTLNISKPNGDFQMYQGDILTVTGRIREPKKGESFLPLQQKLLRLKSELKDDDFKVTNEAFYKDLAIRGYDFNTGFKTILSYDYEKNRAKLKYDNWVTFADAMLQMRTFGYKTRDLFLPTNIETIHCSPRLMKTTAETQVITTSFKANYILANGLEMYGYNTTKARRRPQEQELVLEKYVWLPYMDANAFQEDKNILIKTYIQILEDMAEKKPKDAINDQMNQLKSLVTLNGLTEDNLVIKDLINSDNNEEPINQLVTSDGRRLSSDLLNNLYFDESLLRPAIDIILENTSSSLLSQEFNVLEMNLNQQICYKNVIHYLKDSFHKLNVKYSVFNPIEVESDSNTNSYEKIDINFSMTTKIANVNPLNLVIIREQFPIKDNSNVLGDDVTDEDVFKYFYSFIDSNGFLLILRREEYTNPEKNIFDRFGYKCDKRLDSQQLISLADKIGFSLVSNRSDGNTCSVLLFRKVNTNKIGEDIMIRVSHTEFDSWFESLKNEFKGKQDNPENEGNIWLVADPEHLSGIVGFVNCIRKERGGHRIRCIAGNMFDDLITAKSVSVREMTHTSILDNDLVMNIYKNGVLGSFRFLNLNPDRMSKSMVKHALLKPTKSDNKLIVEWFESKNNLVTENLLNSSNGHKILINVFYCCLNPSDLKRKINSLPNWSLEDNGLCSEFSGLDQNGNKVFGLKPNESLSTTLLFKSMNDLIKVPGDWSLEEACTVPLAYGTAYYALMERAQLRSNNSILIIFGNGYIGNAAIAVSLSLDSQVYTTVTSEESKNELLTKFPNLNQSKVINTSVDCLEEVISGQTSGKGLDFVFDYSNDFPIASSLNCVKQNGKYLLIGENQTSDSCGKGMIDDKNIIIEKINFETLFTENSDQTESPFNSIKYTVLSHIEEGIARRVVRPFDNRMVFDANQTKNALDLVATNRYIHKVLVKIRDESEEENKNDFMVSAVHNTHFEVNRTYIITGGLGGFGLELANWLVLRGARNLVLTSRSGIKNSFQEFTVNRLKSFGAQVLILNIDGIDEKECEQLLKEANSMAPVAGIFALAMVLKDAMFKNQTTEKWKQVLGPKIQALNNLDLISRRLCPNLKYFVAFSSVTSNRGNIGQTNYGYANSYMERVCENRRAEGLPGLTIQWGAIGDVGVVAEHFDLDKVLLKGVGGTVSQRIHSCLSLMNHFLRSSDAVISSLLRHEVKHIQKDKNISSLISTVLGIRDALKIRQMAKLPELGMDSLLIVEIKDSLQKEFGLNLTLEELKNITFGDIIKLSPQ